jgi:hypothetical protein
METWQSAVEGEIGNRALLKCKLAFVSPSAFSSWNPRMIEL